MTTEEKARAYDEALEKAKEIKGKIMSSHLSTESRKAVSEYIDTIIPELAESEDEEMFDAFMHKLEVCDLLTNKEIMWAKLRLKSLRPSWKPSEEQQEADLEEEMDRFFEEMSIEEHENIFEDTYQMIARHFYELGLNARKV